MTPTEFWTKWSHNSVRLPVTHIADRLGKIRRDQDVILASQARMEFSEAGFADAFGYRKGRNKIVCKTSLGVARYYRKCHQYRREIISNA